MKTNFPRLGFLVSILLFLSPVNAADIKVMTQNQYLGAELAPVLAAPDDGTFRIAVGTALQQIAANTPKERMKAIAANILKERPAVVGLQEVYAFQCFGGSACNDPSVAGAFTDHLWETLDALNGAYVPKATVVNLNIPGVPFEVNGASAFIGVIDRDVILVRADVSATPVNYTGICAKPSGEGCNYSFVVSATTPYGPISVERGFVAVDATVDGQIHRVVNTHLELQFPDPSNPLSQVFQAAQAAELMQILYYTTPPGRSLVLLGDMNSSPEHLAIAGPLPLPPPFNLGIPTPYQEFVAAGYEDIWTMRPGSLAGYTCCQLEDLSNQQSLFYERIDMIFSLDAPDKVKRARVVGATVSDRTPPPGLGLWPSDHGSVAAELQF